MEKGEVIDSLVLKGKSYKEIIELTGFGKSAVYTYCWKKYGKLIDRNKSRRNILEITAEQKEILFGTLLGDGNIQKVKNSYQGRTNHSKNQQKYCEYKQQLLQSLTYDVKFTTKTLKGYSKTYEQCYFCLRPNENLKELHVQFYGNGKKDIPNSLELLTPRAMAIWFMDDGTASSKCSISIATCSFSLEGLCRLQLF